MLKRKPKTPSAPETVCRFPTCAADAQSGTSHLGHTHNMNDITWRIFRIMAEFVDGFQFLSTSNKEVTVFGSARLKPNTTWYKEAEAFGRLAAEGGFTIITGGGPGIMEAANKGAFEAGGESLGLNIQLPMEQRANPYITRGKGFHYFFTRKVMLSASAQAYVYFPGGFGTLDELFEMVVLIQTDKMQSIPVVLVGRDFWEPLLAWVKEAMVDTHGTLHQEELNLLQVVDSGAEAWEIVKHSKEREIF